MKTMIFVALLMAIAVIALKVFAARRSPAKALGRFDKRTAVTKNEQQMFWRIAATFPGPDFVVFGQVSFGALLTAKEGASRYSFSQKRADFVLFDKAFTALAVIELDDASHKGKENADRGRDYMLTQAGYKVLRYASIPQPEKLLADVNGVIAAPKIEH
jgi:hypothetical protein